MTIEKQSTGNMAEWKLTGWLDTQSAPELEAELRDLAPEITSLVLDLSEVEYISSAGLRVLLAAHKNMVKKGGMKVLHVNEVVQEVFEVTGFADILTIE